MADTVVDPKGLEALCQKLESAKANGDPTKYLASVTVAEAHAIAAYLRATHPPIPSDAEVEGLVERLRHRALAKRAVGNKAHRAEAELDEQAATLLSSEHSARIAAERERDEARSIVRDIHWMAVRYADGRKSYAPGLCNDALRKAYDAGWLSYEEFRQHDLDPQYAREGDKPEYQHIEARAEAAEQEVDRLRGDGWQDISTAPKDGSEVWVYVSPRDGLEGFQCRCAYHPDAGWCADELREVTHWRPLPAPPRSVLQASQ